MKTRRATAFVIACALAVGSPVRADDTEIFSANPTAPNVPPNVLIILDNSANWSASFGSGTKFSSEIATISSVIGTLDTKLNVGLMLFGETGGGNSSPVTSYVRSAVRNMTASNKNALQNLVQGLNINGDKGSNAPYGFALFEAYKYFGGGAHRRARRAPKITVPRRLVAPDRTSVTTPVTPWRTPQERWLGMLSPHHRAPAT